jgi:hypothetical protein
LRIRIHNTGILRADSVHNKRKAKGYIAAVLWIWIGSGFNDFVDPDLPSKVLLWIRIRIGSGCNDFVDPDPDRAKMLDPY